MRIMKFGGSSLGTPERIKQTCGVIQKSRRSGEQIIVVCSAFGGVTDQLIELGRLASQGDRAYEQTFHALAKRHIEALSHSFIEERLHELEEILRSVFALRECSKRTQDLIMSFGERLSSFTIANHLQQTEPATQYVDTREVIQTDDAFGEAHVDFPRTKELLQTQAAFSAPIVVATGFIGSTKNGETTTLGRGGSDYTASILGALLKAEEIEIWTDVSGVLTADPRKVAGAFPIAEMNYQEAMEMAHFGAKVIYFPTMLPALSAGIPLHIKNTFAPNDPGTRIITRTQENGFPIKGISSIDQMALIRVQGGGMAGVAGIAMRLFAALARAQVSVVMITQGSSEYSICVAIAPEVANIAEAAINEEFEVEVHDGRIEEVTLETNLSVIAVVGERMRQTPGIGGRLFSALGSAGVNVVAVAQGSSERNISLIVSQADLPRALQAIHDHFFASAGAIHLCLIGAGLVGSALLRQIERLPRGMDRPEVKIIAIARKEQMLIAPLGISLAHWSEELAQKSEPTDLEKMSKILIDLALPNTILVDATASEAVIEHYPALLRAGISVVTSNKRAASGEFARLRTIHQAAHVGRSTFSYGTNVGAGLPILTTIAAMKATGDKIQRIEGVLSGTISFLFNRFDGIQPFSALVAEAKTNGYTEPDPREDLSGLDIARKLVVLSRQSGCSIELVDIQVESLADTTDEEMAQRVNEARAQGKVLRYLALLENNQVQVKVCAVGPEHPAFGLTGTDNIAIITSDRYLTQPLVIRGPGAGADVTAAGMLKEILDIG